MLITISWVVGEQYQEEKKIYEERLVEYETVPENEEGYDNIAHENEDTEEFVNSLTEEESIDRVNVGGNGLKQGREYQSAN